MIRTNLRFFSRAFLKDKFFPIPIISGLAPGIAVSIVSLPILQNDLSFDKHHVNHERIYRLSRYPQATGYRDRCPPGSRSPRVGTYPPGRISGSAGSGKG